MPNPYEADARRRKAEKLVDALAGMPGGTDPDVVALLPAEGWGIAAHNAGVAVPSERTQALVVRILRNSAMVAAETDDQIFAMFSGGAA